MTTDQTDQTEKIRFEEQIADSVTSFLLALREIAREGNGSQAISLLLLEISQVLLAGARLGAQTDFTPREEFQPDVGPEADIDELRLRLAEMLEGVDASPSSSTPTSPRSSRAGSPTTWPRSPSTSRTACATSAPVTSTRRCGGGSSPTSTTGATSRERRSTR